MRYEVWTQKPEYDSQHVLMMPEMSHDNEQELIRKGYQVCHVFEAESLEQANELFQDWVKTVSMERFCDGHPAWECTDECVQKSTEDAIIEQMARTILEEPAGRAKRQKLDRLAKSLPPPAEHSIQARMADEKFGPPRPVKLTGEDLKKAIEKHRNPVGGAMRESDAAYMRALEDENAEMHEAMKEGRETVHALTIRIRDLEREKKSLDECATNEHRRWLNADDLYVELRKKARAALVAIERGSKVIEALMPGLRHIAVQNYQEVNEAPIAMAQAADGLRDTLGVQRPENLSETDTESRQKE